MAGHNTFHHILPIYSITHSQLHPTQSTHPLHHFAQPFTTPSTITETGNHTTHTFTNRHQTTSLTTSIICYIYSTSTHHKIPHSFNTYQLLHATQHQLPYSTNPNIPNTSPQSIYCKYKAHSSHNYYTHSTHLTSTPLSEKPQ